MLVFQIVKGLCQAFAETWQNLWRSAGRKMKFGAALCLALLVAAFCVKRFHDSFTEQPPAWLKQKRFSSPALSRSVGEPFQQMLVLAQRYAEQRQIALGSVRELEIQADLTNAVLWTSDTFVNPGFKPLSRFERSLRIDRSRFIGYYTRAGKALDITLKHSPSRPQDLLMTIHLPAPVSPGASELVFRLEREIDRVKRGKDGKYQLGLGRMPGSTAAIHLLAVHLPERAELSGV